MKEEMKEEIKEEKKEEKGGEEGGVQDRECVQVQREKGLYRRIRRKKRYIICGIGE